MRISVRHVIGVFTVAAALLLLSAGVAVAHVTVSPGSAVKGSYTVLTFRVPNELPDADSTELDVQLLQNPSAPIPNVSVKPVPGWTATVTKEHLATPVKTSGGEVSDVVSVIRWTGGSIKPGEFQEFEVSAGPLPSNADQLIFPAVQTYSNGQTVRWVDLPAPKGPEPEHPAPVLKLVDANAAPASDAGSASPGGVTVASQPAKAASSSGLATAGVVLGGIGVLLGAAALLLTLRKRTA